MSFDERQKAADIGQLIDLGAWSVYQKLIIAYAALAFATDGMANLGFGMALPALIADWGLPRGAFAHVAALGLAGVAVGTVLGGILGDRFGRRPLLIGSMLAFGAATAASAACHGPGLLGLLRCLAGLGLGGAIPNGAALVAEFTPMRRRGLGVTIGMQFIPIGGALAGFLASVLLPRFGWQALFLATGGAPVLIALLFFLVLPESPRHLARRPEGRARLDAVLRRCFGPRDPGLVVVDRSAGPKHATPISALFAPAVRTTTLALWVSFFGCFAANYTLLSWGPAMLNGQGYGLGVASSALAVYNLGGILGGLAFGAAIGRVGYRAVLLAAALGSTVCAAALIVLLPAMPSASGATALLGLLGVFIGAAQNGLYAMAAHVYPPFAKGTGVGTASSVGRLGAVISSFTGVATLQMGGTAGFLGGIAVAMAIMTGAAMMLPAEGEGPSMARPVPKAG